MIWTFALTDGNAKMVSTSYDRTFLLAELRAGVWFESMDGCILNPAQVSYVKATELR